MGHLVTLATCSLNQWALDFEGNAQRILQSIKEAKAGGASLRIGPELEITGYGCLDHFLESDTDLHSWESLVMILEDPICKDILLDIGMPVMHKNVKYNARILSLNQEILLIRPKLSLANDGNYREMRYFSPWKGERIVEDFYLPRSVQKLTGQKKCRIGDALISTLDSCMSNETCEELFTPISPALGAGLDGSEITLNSSGSHHELRKLNTRIDLIRQETLKSGGIYLYSNQQGCDGDRLYYDGCAMIIINGRIVAQGSQFSLNDVETIIATVDIEEVRSYRSQKSRALQATKSPVYERVEVNFSLSSASEEVDLRVRPSPEIAIKYHLPEEEIAYGPACWLWDYLRRSSSGGFFLPLSGGVDSCATAVLVHSMCRLVYQAVLERKNPQVIKDLLKIVGEPSDSEWLPSSPQDVASRLFHTAYLGMAENSSKDTRSRAKALAKDIGAYHLDLNIDTVYYAVTTLFTTVTSYAPKFKMFGGTPASNLALQNIQARLRMVLSYLFAQLLPTVRGRNKNNPENQNPGGLLVLGSANVDESLRGYLTKYDCSSADINPIGGIAKQDLKRFILWAATNFDLPILPDFIAAPPTAELEPITADYVQSDEADMGMTYDELSIYGRMRKVDKLGPYGMWSKLLHQWSNKLSPQKIYTKVRWFFWNYGINRHKMTTLTPSYHAEQYSPDDNRFDLRPFLYPSWFGFKAIEKKLAAMGENGTKVADAEERKSL
ncbi:glutamine-dependent NAD(+) synthetase [Pseudogymnoascus destructans]|uniref:Glutamine-dependent NAD(+) synthetase n=2 Tax=Pseudogymnoascus destructans TaxID=655981 RepID=L8G402_PSED2|nr:glutamine-dependent NAD(+) synthetase [Pseudogymnoascus destructans]ELR08005.1 NAD synthase [Pseudogymnoascus destructans 20631-21]OAF63413.2 glutamine-dependent NAD(+) synthetase [Pseudogymnoascus destructans]